MSNKNNKNKEPSKLNEAGRMSFVEHFSELRKRIIYVFIAIVICTGFSWHLSYKAINIIETPLEKPTYITYFAGYAKKIIKKKIPFVYYSFGLNKTPKKFQKHILHYSKPLEPFLCRLRFLLFWGL